MERRTETWAAGLFAAGAVSQYIGAAIAVDLFDEVPAQSVAWLRVCGAALVLAVVARPWRRRWTRLRGPALRAAAAFGAITALMNTCFYLAADRLPLGTTVAIEFLGPISVAALSLRTRRSVAALALAGGGVALLSGIELSGSAIGVLFALGAAACWAGYIVLGARVSNATAGVDGLALALLFGAVVVAPIGAPGSGPAFTAPHRLLLCLGIGVLSTALPYAIDQIVLRRLERGTFALLLALLPTTATIVGAVHLDQHLRTTELVGIAAVVAALLVRGGSSPPVPVTEGDAISRLT